LDLKWAQLVKQRLNMAIINKLQAIFRQNFACKLWFDRLTMRLPDKEK